MKKELNENIKNNKLKEEKIIETKAINAGLKDLENGKVIAGETVFNEIKNKYGFKNNKQE